jgi:hypothetical protein
MCPGEVVVEFLEGGVKNSGGVVLQIARQMCPGARQMCPGRCGVDFLEGAVKNVRGVVHSIAHQMSPGGGGVRSGGAVVKVLEGVVIQFARQMCPGARRMCSGEGGVNQFTRRGPPDSPHGWSDEGRRYGADSMDEEKEGTAECAEERRKENCKMASKKTKTEA